MNSGQHLVYSLDLSEGGSACGEGQRADPDVFLVQRSCTPTKEDVFVVTGCSEEYQAGFCQVLSPAFQQVLDLLQPRQNMDRWNIS